MLKQRLLTALIAIPFVVALVLFAPRGVIAWVLGAFVLAGGWEWAALAGYRARRAKLLYVALIAAILLVLSFTLAVSGVTGAVITIALLWWLSVVAALCAYAATSIEAHRVRSRRWLIGLCGLLTLVPAWQAVAAIRGLDDGPGWLLFMLALIWIADSGAYAAGRLLGQRRLVPRISPGKTWEGVAGGLAAAAVVGICGGMIFGVPLAWFVPVCILTAIFSIVGDLSESFFKRLVGIKDSGNVFPGHGGILDRLDSLSAGAPVFYACLWALSAG